MFKYLLFFFLLFYKTNTFGQRVYPKTAKLILIDYSSLSNDGLIFFEIEVRMSDCISQIELIDIDNYKLKKNIWDKLYDFWWFKIMKVYNFSKTKKFSKEISESDYTLKDLDDGKEHILMDVSLLNIKSLYSRKETTKRIRIILHSFSGKIIYDKNFNIDKTDLIQNRVISF